MKWKKWEMQWERYIEWEGGDDGTTVVAVALAHLYFWADFDLRKTTWDAITTDDKNEWMK